MLFGKDWEIIFVNHVDSPLQVEGMMDSLGFSVGLGIRKEQEENYYNRCFPIPLNSRGMRDIIHLFAYPIPERETVRPLQRNVKGLRFNSSGLWE